MHVCLCVCVSLCVCLCVRAAVFNRTRLPWGYPTTVPLPNMSLVLFVDSVVNGARSDAGTYMVVTVIPNPGSLVPAIPPLVPTPIIEPTITYTILPEPPSVSITPVNASDTVRYTLYSSVWNTTSKVECPNVTEQSPVVTGNITIPYGLVWVCARTFAAADGRMSGQVCVVLLSCPAPHALLMAS